MKKIKLNRYIVIGITIILLSIIGGNYKLLLNYFDNKQDEKLIQEFYQEDLSEDETTEEVVTEEAVITCINNYFKLIDDLKNKLSNIVNFSEIEYNETINDIRKQELDIEIGKCKKKINEVINDYGKGFISQRDYENFKSSYVYDLNQLNIEKEKLNNSNEENNLSWLKNFKDTNEINEVDRSIVINFIDEIIVGNNKDIEVVLKFKNKYYQAIDYLKRHNL